MKQKIISIIFALILLMNIIPIINASTITDSVDFDNYVIDYSYDSTEAQAGERFNLVVTVTNEDDESKEDIILSIDSNNIFDIDSDYEEWDIGTLSPGESKIKTFRIEVDEEALSDKYELDFNFEDSDDEWDDYFNIDVDSNKVDIIISSIESSPLTLIPDTEDVKITANLENQGGINAKFVKAKLILPEGFTPSNSYSDIYNIGAISAESSNKAIFYINIDKSVKSGLYNGTIELDYSEDNEDKKVSLDFDLPVYGTPQFKIDSVIPETKVMQGATSKIRVKITNIGDKTAKETSIKVFERSDNPFTFTEKTYFIGTLESGESGTAIFEVKTDSDADINTYLVNAQIRTLDEGSVIVSDETINIKVNKYEKTTQDYIKIILIIVLVIIIVIGIIIYSVFKKRKNRENNLLIKNKKA